MKILCVADHVDPLVYSNSIRDRFKEVKLVLGAGDLHLEYYGYIVSSLNLPLCFVFGNHNLERIKDYRREYRHSYSYSMESSLARHMQQSYGSTYVGGKAVKVKGLLIAGLGGSMRYNKGENQFTEIGMFFYSLKLLPRLIWNRLAYGRFLDILLTHAPPYGIHDKDDPCHRGFKFFRLFMDIFKPKFLIHGHVHLYDLNAQRETVYKETRVVNAYDHAVIEIEVQE